MFEFFKHSLPVALPIIASLVVLESLLSIDNALVLAAMVAHLPEKQQPKALRYGMLGAYLMRGLTIAFVFWLIANPWIKLVAGTYLIYLMSEHLGGDDDDGAQESKHKGFWATVVTVELMDMMFSLDNIAAAAAFTDKLWVILTGVFIGIAAMRFIAQKLVPVIEKFPVLATVAYVLVGWVGIQLWLERVAHFELSEMGKFGSIMAIIALGLAYERVPVVRAVLKPFLSIFGYLFGKFAALVNWFFTPVRWAGSAVVEMFK